MGDDESSIFFRLEVRSEREGLSGLNERRIRRSLKTPLMPWEEDEEERRGDNS